MTHTVSRPYGDGRAVSRRALYAGVLSGIGVLLGGIHVVHGVANLQAGTGLFGVALGAIVPLVLAGALVAVGYRLHRSDLTGAQLRRIAGWCLLGVAGILLLAGTGVIYQRFHGTEVAHLPFVLVNFATGGGIVGILIGWYDVQMRARTRELRVFRKAVEHSGHSIYMTDTDGTIEYVNPAYESQTGYDREEAIGRDPSVLKSGEHDEDYYEELWETILNGDIWTGETINQNRAGEDYVVNQTIAPVTDEDGEIERFVAINSDITDKKRRQEELERQRDELAQLHQMTATMWEVTQGLVEASTESELQEQVCNALVSTEFCDAAWIDTYDSRSETLTPESAAGIDESTLEPVSVEDTLVDADGAVPSRVAVDRSEVAVTEFEEGDGNQPREASRTGGQYRTAAAVPIVHDDLVYGTLTLCSTEGTVGESERDQFEELGDAVAHGLDSIKTRKLLHADQVVELGCRAQDERDLFVDASVRADCTLSLSGTVPLADDRTLLYVALEEGTVEALREVTASRDDVEQLRVIDDGEPEQRLTLVVEPATTVAQRLTDLGTQIEQARVAGGELSITAYLAPNQSVRSVVEEVQETFPDFELVAKRETDRNDDEHDSSLQSQLSDRQRAALFAAYHAGYFKSPRESTAEEIASEMGIAGPTFHKHLRRAQKILLDTVLDIHPQGLASPDARRLQI
jgi:PAS domain S-box-containing protein